MKLPSFALALVTFLCAQSAFAALSADQRLSDFDQLVNTIRRNYGPLQLKRNSIGLDFNADVAAFKQKIAAARNDAEFYQLLARFLSTLKDAHVSSIVPSTYRGTLGFTVDRVEGKVLIDTIDTLRLPPSLFPFQKGDSVVAIDGVSVESLVADFDDISNTGNPEGSLRIATSRLTTRKQGSGFNVPTGMALVTVLPRGAAQSVTVSASWINTGNPILELDDLSRFLQEASDTLPSTSGADLLRELRKLDKFSSVMPRSFLAEMHEGPQGGVSDIGSPRSMFPLPQGARELSGFAVTAATFEAAGKRIGLLRIPTYMDEGLLAVLGRAVKQLDPITDVLVLDQTNNPGGSVSLVSDIVGLFAERTYTDMMYQLRPSLNWVKQIDDINDKIAQMLAADPSDETANALKARFQMLGDELRGALREHRFLTKPVSLNLTGTFGVIQPNTQARYTKPVLLLINELDFSGGDAFPAIMKDNGRAKLFGARTNGAGGNVAEYGPLANSFFKFNVTESLMVRPNGSFVENAGVQPDVAYAITQDDFLNGYRGYVKAFTIEALKLAGAAPAAIETFRQTGR